MVFRIFMNAIVVIYLFLFVQNGHSQNPLEQEAEVFSNAADAEKIYLQLSGKSFNTSETIWFKAVVTDVLYHRPTKKSGVLHVELIDPLNNWIVDKTLLKISGGISSGFFQLHSNYREGNYMVRAYTEWNENFGPDFITSIPISLYRLQKNGNRPDPIRDVTVTKNLGFNKFSLSSTIAVEELDSLNKGDAMLYMQWEGTKDSILINQSKNKPIINVKHMVPMNVPIINYQLKTDNEVFTKSIVLDDEYGSLQFFPEGGSLVEGLQSIVGFKYLNYRGKGTEILGTIEDGNKTKVAEFKSNTLGMGKVILIPEAGQTYYGVLTNKDGISHKYQLPKAKERGQVLSLVQNGLDKELRIWNKEKNNDSLYIKFFHRGKNLFFLKGRFKKGLFSFRIQSKNLPHGIIGSTIYDKDFKPVAERHFFNEPKEKNLNIKIETDRDQYFIRDSVQVSISTKLNGHAAPASVSVIAIDSSYFYGTNLERNTIVSYFLLQSDIRGTVENPSYYFKNNNNLAEIDFLMLTQGWTNYKYKEKKKPRRFNAEQGLEIKGTVDDVQRANKKDGLKKGKYELNMLLMGEPMEVYIQETDSSGHFKFALNDSYGLGRKFVIQPTDSSNNSGELKININEYEVPEISYEMEKVIVPVDSFVQKQMIQKIEEDIRLDPLLLPNTIALNEVVVSDYRVTPERAGMVELHGIPDVVIDNKELLKKQKKWTNNLYRWLLFNYPNEIRVKRVGNGAGFEVAYVHGADWTYVVIDGIPVHERDYNLIGNVPVKAVKSVEIIRNTSTANTYHNEVFDCAPVCPPPPFPAILAIYTYSGDGLSGAFPKSEKTNLINDTAPQYSPIREYYVPEYHDPSQIDWSVPDRRTLLYWHPTIVTDSNGQAKTTFFNSDISGKMVLICEGITLSGKIGYSEVFYEVDTP
ncbi:hypothetical protein LCGC14_0433760 [marine sediment metagenome]|uniref:MG2 domain-containing protein n=2 Tax=root TaxID=1 RepID=A0A831VSE5_9FLAO|nr:hypothetical protein [Pricia sp.]HEA22007.1 hypothetical protein [Pricia antarctica]